MELESIRIFVKVVQHGSFSKAAGVLKMPKSTVSRTISGLESDSGTKLLVRTTRSLRLTAAGRVFYEGCIEPIQVLEDARKSLHGQDSIVSGIVRITAPEDLGTQVISSVVGDLMLEHPGLSFELEYTDDVIDLVKEGFDLAIRIGKPSPSRLKIRKLGEVVLVMVASPDYLKKKGTPRHPQDLPRYDCIAYIPDSSHLRWVLRSKKEVQSISLVPRVIGNQMSSLVGMAEQGAGIALVPKYLCRKRFESGGLVQVLPEWSEERLQVSLISPLAAGSVTRLKIVSDRLASEISKVL